MKSEVASIRELCLSDFESNQFNEYSHHFLLRVLLTLTLAGYYFQLIGAYNFSNTATLLPSTRTHIFSLQGTCVGNIGQSDANIKCDIVSIQPWTNITLTWSSIVNQEE